MLLSVTCSRDPSRVTELKPTDVSGIIAFPKIGAYDVITHRTRLVAREDCAAAAASRRGNFILHACSKILAVWRLHVKFEPQASLTTTTELPVPQDRRECLVQLSDKQRLKKESVPRSLCSCNTISFTAVHMQIRVCSKCSRGTIKARACPCVRTAREHTLPVLQLSAFAVTSSQTRANETPTYPMPGNCTSQPRILTHDKRTAKAPLTYFLLHGKPP
jgi:hypothetical protein